MKKYASIFVFLVIHGGLWSQQEKLHEVRGGLSDLITGEPLADVNIVTKDSKYGTTTDQLGEFILYLKKIPVIIELSHVGYETITIVMEALPLSELDVKLKRKTETLTENTITSQKIDTLFIDNQYSVMDYALMKDGILLLIYKYKITRSELLFTDYDGKILEKLRVLPGKPLLLSKIVLKTFIWLLNQLYIKYFWRPDKFSSCIR